MKLMKKISKTRNNNLTRSIISSKSTKLCLAMMKFITDEVQEMQIKYSNVSGFALSLKALLT